MNLIDYTKGILRGQSLTRITMNFGFKKYSLKGKVVDVGGGRSPDYFQYFKKENGVSVEAIDGSINKIDFERDSLPYTDNTVDTVICANVLEHIFNFNHLVKEMNRILKSDGQIIGYVPFMINYHPDPNDYFRYSDESLKKIFAYNGFKNIVIDRVGGGTFFVNFNNIMLSLPIILRTALFPFVYLFDNLYNKLRPYTKIRFPLGYIFYANK